MVIQINDLQTTPMQCVTIEHVYISTRIIYDIMAITVSYRLKNERVWVYGVFVYNVSISTYAHFRERYNVRVQQTTPHAKWSCAEYWVKTADRRIITYYILLLYGGRGRRKEQSKKNCLDPRTNERESEEIKVPPPARTAASVQITILLL